ncbi:MAG: hypothetical protein U1U88_000481 [Lawsonella clevelandensis]
MATVSPRGRRNAIEYADAIIGVSSKMREEILAPIRELIRQGARHPQWH